MTQPKLWQTQISIDDEPAADRYDAEFALKALDLPFHGLYTEDEEAGIYLVGFTGEVAIRLEGGEYFTLESNGLSVEVPQP